MGFKEAMNTVLRQKYATFEGRAARSEFWWFYLGFLLMAAFCGVIIYLGFDQETQQMGSLGYLGIGLFGIVFIGCIIPWIAVTIRRFHDRDMSGWWVLGFFLIGFIPVVGGIAGIVQLVILCLKGTTGENRFGQDPLLGSSNPDVFS